MAYEDTYDTEQVPTSATWQQYYPSPQDVPYGYQFNENQALANALRGYNQEEAMRPVTYMPGYEDTLTRKLLEKNNANLTTTQPRQQGGGMQMPTSMNFLGGAFPQGAMGTGNLFGGPAGQATGQMGAYGAQVDAAGTTSGQAGSLGWGASPAGEAVAQPGAYSASSGTSSGGTGFADSMGMGGGGTASAYGGAALGALGGYMAGRENYKNDPNMWNGKDGYGKYHKDYRAEVGGGTLGGVMGYFGGPIGGALAYPTVKVAHKFMEPATRKVINFGDKVGGSGGALMLDPIGTVSSGKYSWGELGKGALLGPATKLFK